MVWIVVGVLLLVALVGLLLLWGSNQLISPPEPDLQSDPGEYSLPYLEVVFPSRDGLRLHGWFIPAQGSSLPPPSLDNWSGKSKGTVIFCHGRFGSKDPDLRYAPWVREAGYNTFLFDFRGHGRSEGRYSSFGYLERLDLLGAIDLLQSKGIPRFGVLGFSLGGAVGIATAGECEAIAAVVSDGGFMALKEAVRRGMRERGLSLPLATLVASLLIWVAGRRLGCDLSHSDPIRWVGRIAPRALLLIHGGKDTYVSVDDVRRLYEAAGEPKELWMVAEVGHREVDKVRPDGYRQKVVEFFDRYLIEGEARPHR